MRLAQVGGSGWGVGARPRVPRFQTSALSRPAPLGALADEYASAAAAEAALVEGRGDRAAEEWTSAHRDSGGHLPGLRRALSGPSPAGAMSATAPARGARSGGVRAHAGSTASGSALLLAPLSPGSGGVDIGYDDDGSAPRSPVSGAGPWGRTRGSVAGGGGGGSGAGGGRRAAREAAREAEAAKVRARCGVNKLMSE